MSIFVNSKNYYFVTPNNKNGLSSSLPTNLHKSDSLEFICELKVNPKEMKKLKYPGYIISLNGKHLGIYAGPDYVGSSIWTTTGEHKITLFPGDDIKSKISVHLKIDIKNKLMELTVKGKNSKSKKINFDGEIDEDYQFSYLWIGCGNGLDKNSSFPLIAEISKVKIIKNNKTIVKSDCERQTPYKVFDQSNSGNHLIKYDKEWFE